MPQQQLFEILFDDFIADTPRVFAQVEEFLGLSHETGINIRVVNAAHRFRHNWLAPRLVVRPPDSVLNLVAWGKRRLGIHGTGLRRLADRRPVVRVGTPRSCRSSVRDWCKSFKARSNSSRLCSAEILRRGARRRHPLRQDRPAVFRSAVAVNSFLYCSQHTA